MFIRTDGKATGNQKGVNFFWRIPTQPPQKRTDVTQQSTVSFTKSHTPPAQIAQKLSNQLLVFAQIPQNPAKTNRTQPAINC
ncbi:hypothetical protein EBU99_14515 [bacterium]|nr:hypothetical protein [bacterium]